MSTRWELTEFQKVGTSNMQVFTVLNKVRGLNKTILLKWNNSKDLLFCWKTGFWSNIPFNTSPNANLNLRTFLFVRRDHIVDPRPRRFISAMASSFVMNGHKGPQPHRLITAQWLFYLLCMATQADYSITAPLLAVLGYVNKNEKSEDYSKAELKQRVLFFITIFRLAIPAFFRFTDVTELM